MHLAAQAVGLGDQRGGAVAGLWLSPLMALAAVVVSTLLVFFITVAALGVQFWMPAGAPMGLAFAAGGTVMAASLSNRYIPPPPPPQ